MNSYTSSTPRQGNITHSDLPCQTADTIIKKLNCDMAEHIFRFIGGEELMRTADIANMILSYLGWADIMRARVSRKWREAAKMTIVVPQTPSDTASAFVVDSVDKFNAMRVISTALPNMQQITIADLGHEDIYSNGEDPIEVLARSSASLRAHDINNVSSFKQLRVLHMCNAPLNGRYPLLFAFPLLEKLHISDCYFLKWDLAMLEGLPLLKELQCAWSNKLTGNVSSLRTLKDSLEKVEFANCAHVQGDFMDLADFHRLKEVDLRDTSVTGDIRHIRDDSFPALESLALPESVVGGCGHEFQHVSEVPSLMDNIHLLLQRTPSLFPQNLVSRAFDWSLSKKSPDWYTRKDGNESPPPPFSLQIIQAGSRLCWNWCTHDGEHGCEINWLDSEPSKENDDRETYIEHMQRISFYRGYSKPPTEEEYIHLCDGLKHRD